MADGGGDYKTAAELFRLGGDLRELALLNHPRLTAPQRAFCENTERKLLWRGGNSIGKSYAHAWDLVHFARGTHPWRAVPAGRRKIMVAGYSYAQMDPLLEKLWELLPKGEIDPKHYRVEGQGIKGYKEPVVRFVSGPGAGSTIYLATYEQGAERVMGFQGHRLSLDEPPPEDIYAEAVPRLNFHRGELRITMTPTPASPPLAYMRELVTSGKITEMQTSYCVESTTILGGLIPWSWKTADQIEEDLAGYLADELPMRRDGAWEAVVVGRWLSLVTAACEVDGDIDRGRRWTIAVGIDHGTRPGRQSASLVLMDEDGEVWILDEHRTGEASSADDDARGILAMLARWGIPWQAVDLWVGDRATSESYWGTAKSNQDLQQALAAQLRLSSRAAADQGLRIETVKKGANSKRRGVSLINTLAHKRKLRVHKRHAGFWAAVQGWKGDDASPLKDAVDSARYAVMTLVDRAGRGATPTTGYVGA